MKETMKVTGKGTVFVKPDLIRLSIRLEGVYEKYEEALQQSSEQAEQLKLCFEKAGFSKEDLKTLSFHINTEYENYRDKKNEWKKKFVGYKFIHEMKIEFEADNRLLGKVLYAMSHCQAKPEFQITYTIKNEEDAKNLLLKRAVEDSKKKAKILAEAAEINLGNIICIDYSWEKIHFTSSPVNRMAIPYTAMQEECGASYDINIEPDNIEVSDTVTIMWEIE